MCISHRKRHAAMTHDDQPYRFYSGFCTNRQSGADIHLLRKLFTPDKAGSALHLSSRLAPARETREHASPEYTADGLACPASMKGKRL